MKNQNLHYVIGDATYPEKIVTTGPKVIAHICNDQGGWGAGFVLAINKRWPEPKAAYLQEIAQGGKLGEMQVVPVDNQGEIFVANMIAQTLGYVDGRPPIRYGALYDCLVSLVAFIDHPSTLATVHMPRIGSGLAGGDWKLIESLVVESLCDNGVPTYVYDLEQS